MPGPERIGGRKVPGLIEQAFRKVHPEPHGFKDRYPFIQFFPVKRAGRRNHADGIAGQ